MLFYRAALPLSRKTLNKAEARCAPFWRTWRKSRTIVLNGQHGLTVFARETEPDCDATAIAAGVFH